MVVTLVMVVRHGVEPNALMGGLFFQVVHPFLGDERELVVHVAFDDAHVVEHLEQEVGFRQAEIELVGNVVGVNQLRVGIFQILRENMQDLEFSGGDRHKEPRVGDAVFFLVVERSYGQAEEGSLVLFVIAWQKGQARNGSEGCCPVALNQSQSGEYYRDSAFQAIKIHLKLIFKYINNFK
jgi:hypothetical protein